MSAGLQCDELCWESFVCLFVSVFSICLSGCMGEHTSFGSWKKENSVWEAASAWKLMNNRRSRDETESCTLSQGKNWALMYRAEVVSCTAQY